MTNKTMNINLSERHIQITDVVFNGDKTVRKNFNTQNPKATDVT